MPKKLTTKTFIEKAIQTHGETYDYSNCVYTRSTLPVRIICKVHGEFRQRPTDHVFHKAGCPKCGLLSRTSKQINTQECFLRNAVDKHGGRYEYSLVNYINTNTKVEIICRVHGSFFQTPKNHLRGMGCRSCGRNNVVKFNTKKLEHFLKRAKSVHGERYDYSESVYIGSNQPLKIKCKEHGDFFQMPGNHTSGSGCPTCGEHERNLSITKSQVEFIEESVAVHKDKYNYSRVSYVNHITKVSIVCNKHGMFKQTPASHLTGSGCPQCSNTISSLETLWLDCLKIEKRQQVINLDEKRFRVDGFDPTTNTVYEFLGDFWHGNPKKHKSDDTNALNKTAFGVLYVKTLERFNQLRRSGYNVVYIWESDFKRLKKYFVALKKDLL